MPKRGLLLEPGSGILHHLLGAVYAQLGMTDRAIEQMTQAVAHAPELHMARFQLGMLHFSTMDAPAAEEAWGPLSELPADDPLYLFRSGLLHLARDEYEDRIAELRRGLERNTEHPSLNSDIEAMIEIAQQALTERSAPAVSATASASPGHVLLSGYQGLRDRKPN